MNNFEILGETEKSKNKFNKKLILIIIIVVIFVISLITYFLLTKKKPKDYNIYEAKSQIYKEQGIDYSYNDYKQDKEQQQNQNNKKSNSEKLSEPTKKLLNKNDELLQDIKKDTMIEANVTDIIKSIEKQTQDLNKFINNHCGYPDSEYGEEYEGVKKYIDEVISSMSGGKEPKSMYENSIQDIQAELRYSILEQVQYNVGNGYTKYNDCLNNYMKLKHPILNEIETISLNKSDNKMYDENYLCNLEAMIINKNTKYKVYLSSQLSDDDKPVYKILDISKF